MKLRNFPYQNAKPRGAEQTRHYVEALALKRTADNIADAFAGKNGQDADLDISADGVALNNNQVYTYELDYSRLTGALSLDAQKEPAAMQVDVNPDRGYDQTFSLAKDGDKLRYTRRREGSDVVDHLVHDLATDTINYFARTPEGQFVSNS